MIELLLLKVVVLVDSFNLEELVVWFEFELYLMLLFDDTCAEEDVDDDVVDEVDADEVVIGGDCDCGGNVCKSSELLSNELCDAALFKIFKNSSNSIDPFSKWNFINKKKRKLLNKIIVTIGIKFIKCNSYLINRWHFDFVL